ASVSRMTRLSSAAKPTAMELSPLRMRSIGHKRVVAGRLRADLVLHDLGRLRRQGQEREEVAPAERIGTKPRFETPQRVLVLKQCDDDAFRRGMLALREPGVSAAGCRLECRRMSSQDVESFGLLAFPEPEAREPKEHVGRRAADSQSPC